ncbi:hypothetical protein D3C85_1314630 [compost metagenome]
MISAVHHTMNPVICQLICHIYTTVTQDTAVHVQFDLISDIDRIKGSAFLFVARSFFSVFETKILQMTFTCLVTNRAIQRVIDQQKLRYGSTVIVHTL